MLTSKDVPKAPSVLADVVVTPRDKKIIGEVVPSWAILNKILMAQKNRVLMTKKALLMELAGKRRPYECGRMMAHIIQVEVTNLRDTATRELERCLG